jgi:singapore isolate B (sub-type 7) whole genome shotgun sequence assembly, scaffold_15
MNGRFKEGDWSRKWWMTFVKRDFMNLELTLI